jgi:polyhydroxyalkanoate synthesis repressor PhaR
MPARPVIIKKYENRRLYDTSRSRYVNLEDIAQMVREGNEVRVIDAATGEDLTRLVLTQIIVENAKAPDSVFPIDMLRQMVIASGRLSQEGLQAYMKAMFDMYQNTYRTFSQGFSPFEFVHRPKTETAREASTSASASEENSAPANDHISMDDLRQRVEELERLVAKTSRARPVARRNRGPRAKA